MIGLIVIGAIILWGSVGAYGLVHLAEVRRNVKKQK